MFVVSRYLRPERVLLDLKSTKREEAIQELAELLRDAPEVKDFERFLSDVMRREKQGSTAIGLGIAIPHARTESVEGFVIAVGRAKTPIKWPSPDGEPVKLLFLMGTSTKIIARYIQIVAHLTRILRHEDFRQKLLEVESARAFVDAFVHEERMER